ncbi:MAG: ammonium transporter [Candidatus Hydrogenedentes bacterium]|nr:ammonium transporter [Candidatus Hydrogenedentota bacterium]
MRAGGWRLGRWCAMFAGGLFLAQRAHAQEISAGDTAWILTASALVLFMMIPGLAMFYGGLVRVKNVLSVYMQCFVIAAIVTVIWVAFGYSLAFGSAEGGGIRAFIGPMSKVFMQGVTADSAWGTIPEPVFFIFQLTFAIITPGLIVGAFAERMKFSAMIIFSALWVIFGYLPVAHMVWGGEGAYFYDKKVIDFAGGIVVHITAGVSALVAAIMVGKRRGYPTSPMPPHNMTMTLTGTAMLWVGWFGFNGGSALAANGTAGMAIVVTQISPSVAALTWMMIEWVRIGKPSALGFATGAIAGLAAITPAAGSVGPGGAVIIGLVSGICCYLGATTIKRRFGYDDSLDVVGVHGVGGIVGTILLSVFASDRFGGTMANLDIAAQLQTQIFAAVACGAWCAVVSVVILGVLRATIGLRPNSEHEMMGLDQCDHGETGYILTP